MQCSRCGALLRDSARFCNQCGAVQAPNADALSTDTAEQPGRAKRPSRPLRPADDNGSFPGVVGPSSRPLERRTAILNGYNPTPATDAPSGGASDRLNALSPTPTTETPAQQPPVSGARDAIADQPTNEYAAITPNGGQPYDAATGQAPWPLPVGDVLEGRYRIEAVADASPDSPGAENVYRVVDLRGYERCWSCGTQHGNAVQGERFCPQCGADMLSHEYLMTERREETEHDTRPELPITQDETAAATPERVFAWQGRRYQVAEIEVERTRFPFGPHVTITGMSHVGLTRAGETNEDSFGSLALNLAQDSHRQPLAIAIVADGLGGHASGQDASRLAVRFFMDRLTRTLVEHLVAPLGSTLPPDDVVEAALREAAQTANTAVFQANVKGGAGDMGSTLVALVIVGEMAWIVNVGDSRGYVQDGDSLRRITSDHSLVEQLILGGMITPEERYTHPQRNRIYKSLGGEEQVELDIFTQRLRPGIRLLLCSDGLWEMTRDPEIEQILRTTESPYAACAALIASANEHGGEDNITAVLVQIDA